VTDDPSITEFARNHRLDVAAVLVQIAQDASAPAAARASAAERILAYSDGKPSQARQLSVADLATMPDTLKEELLHALLGHYLPSGFQALLKQACNDAVAQFAAKQASLPKPQPKNRFTRQSPAPATEPPAADPGAAAIRSDSSAVPAAPGVHSRPDRLPPSNPL
jgi:hypothetical protein